MNPNDAHRQTILQWFYDRNRTATSQYGKNGSSVKISDVKKGLKEECGMTQQEVMSNLTYLIDKGWINRSEVEKTVKVKGGTIPSKVVWYEISASGIDKIEGDSVFRTGGKYSGINIEAVGTNIITTGDGNYVYAEFRELHSELTSLKSVVAESSLPEPQKLDTLVDIESLRDQLVKSNPDGTIVGHLWKRIQEVATIGGFADVVSRISPLVMGLVSAQ